MSLMYCTRLGLGSRQSLLNFAKTQLQLSKVNYAQVAAGTPKIDYKKFEAPKVEDFETRNARLSRPLSPHLTIYSFQLTTMLSITHRATGLALTAYVSAIGISALVGSHDVSHYITMYEGLNLSPAVLFLAKSIVAAPFAYHLANGIRHLVWDMAKGLSIKDVYKSGYTVLGLSTLLTIALALL